MKAYVYITFALLTAHSAAYKCAPCSSCSARLAARTRTASAAVGRSDGLAARQRCTRASTSREQSSGALQRSGEGGVCAVSAGCWHTKHLQSNACPRFAGRLYQSCRSPPDLSPLAAALQLVAPHQLVQQPAQLVNVFIREQRAGGAAESGSGSGLGAQLVHQRHQRCSGIRFAHAFWNMQQARAAGYASRPAAATASPASRLHAPLVSAAAT